MNVRLLRRVQRAILKHPDQFNMRWWFHALDATGRPAGGCGTAACIGGWALALSKKLTPMQASRHDLHSSDYANLLGLTPDQADRLFIDDEWPAKYQLFQCATVKGMARLAARRIDWFIKSNGTK